MVDIIPGGPGGASGGSGPGALPGLQATEIPVGDNSSVRVKLLVYSAYDVSPALSVLFFL